jgi:hypothetical protein
LDSCGAACPKLIPVNDGQRRAVEAARQLIWWFYADLKAGANRRSRATGEFGVISLAQLRARAARRLPRRGRPRMRLIQGDGRRLHADPHYEDALFQVASQFDALEMTEPTLTPEDGVTRYAKAKPDEVDALRGHRGLHRDLRGRPLYRVSRNVG